LRTQWGHFETSSNTAACIGGVFTLGFGIGASVVTNNIAALAALANGLLPMRRVAQLEAERRHVLEMELRQSGLLRESGPQMRLADFGGDLARSEVPLTSGNAEARHSRRPAIAAD
jgi:hypothetical protein